SEENVFGHLITEMIRPARRGLLRSGCFAAWARGLHRVPLSLCRFREADFLTAFDGFDYTVFA
ncbi:MAG: hypothetical protein IKN53_01740, partial [Oscillibacter sp.]|nr:hypothetical protein [Oscillibacter sp.]